MQDTVNARLRLPSQPHAAVHVDLTQAQLRLHASCVLNVHCLHLT
jgi:hypothetical protein